MRQRDAELQKALKAKRAGEDEESKRMRAESSSDDAPWNAHKRGTKGIDPTPTGLAPEK